MLLCLLYCPGLVASSGTLCCPEYVCVRGYVCVCEGMCVCARVCVCVRGYVCVCEGGGVAPAVHVLVHLLGDLLGVAEVHRGNHHPGNNTTQHTSTRTTVYLQAQQNT